MIRFHDNLQSVIIMDRRVSRRPPDCVPACCKYCTVRSLLIFTHAVRFYRTPAFSHEYNARYGNPSFCLSVCC